MMRRKGKEIESETRGRDWKTRGESERQWERLKGRERVLHKGTF
jgi:hypothetical protein